MKQHTELHTAIELPLWHYLRSTEYITVGGPQEKELYCAKNLGLLLFTKVLAIRQHYKSTHNAQSIYSSTSVTTSLGSSSCSTTYRHTWIRGNNKYDAGSNKYDKERSIPTETGSTVEDVQREIHFGCCINLCLHLVVPPSGTWFAKCWNECCSSHTRVYFICCYVFEMQRLQTNTQSTRQHDDANSDQRLKK